jgi:hypothetical protein
MVIGLAFSKIKYEDEQHKIPFSRAYLIPNNIQTREVCLPSKMSTREKREEKLSNKLKWTLFRWWWCWLWLVMRESWSPTQVPIINQFLTGSSWLSDRPEGSCYLINAPINLRKPHQFRFPLRRVHQTKVSNFCSSISSHVQLILLLMVANNNNSIYFQVYVPQIHLSFFCFLLLESEIWCTNIQTHNICTRLCQISCDTFWRAGMCASLPLHSPRYRR